MVKNGMRPVHPGEILREEFMRGSDPGINANSLAKALAVPPNRITATTRAREVLLAILPCVWQPFNTTAEFWMNLQKAYELRLAEKALPDRVKRHIEHNRSVPVST